MDDFEAEKVYLILNRGRRKCRQWLEWVILLKSLLSADSAMSSTVITSRIKPYR